MYRTKRSLSPDARNIIVIRLWSSVLRAHGATGAWYQEPTDVYTGPALHNDARRTRKACTHTSAMHACARDCRLLRTSESPRHPVQYPLVAAYNGPLVPRIVRRLHYMRLNYHAATRRFQMRKSREMDTPHFSRISRKFVNAFTFKKKLYILLRNYWGFAGKSAGEKTFPKNVYFPQKFRSDIFDSVKI